MASGCKPPFGRNSLCKSVLSCTEQMQLSKEFFNAQNLHQFFGVILLSRQKTAGTSVCPLKCEVTTCRCNSKRGIKKKLSVTSKPVFPSVQFFDSTLCWSPQSMFVEWTARLSQRLLNNGAEAGRRVSSPPQCSLPEVELYSFKTVVTSSNSSSRTRLRVFSYL